MNILITGSSKGIGYELVNYFANQANHHIIGLARNNPRQPYIIHAKKNSRVTHINADLKNILVDKTLISTLKKTVPHLDILINNAALLVNKPFSEIAPELAMEIFTVNFFAPAELIRQLHTHFASGAHIVNIGSMGGFQGSAKFPGMAYYSASKAALSNLGECLAVEFANEDIRVNTLAPGAVATQMMQEAFPGLHVDVSPQQMAEFIGHFACTGQQLFNGKTIPVSGTTP